MTHRPLRQWLVAAAVAVTMASTGSVHAAGALRTVPAQLEKAEASKYAEGKRAYEKQDYATAGKTFTALLGRVPESPANRTIRASLVLDAMAAYRAAYEGSGDVAMLRSGMDAYYGYFRAYRDAHGSSNIPESVVEARFVMKEALERAQSGKPNDGTPNDGTPNDGTPNNGTPNDGRPSNGTPNDGTPNDGTPSNGVAVHASTDDAAKPGTTLIATGAVLLVLGLGSTALIGIGAVNGKRAREDQKAPGFSPDQRSEFDRRGRTANTMLIAGAVVAPVLAIAGVSLIAVGATNKRKARLAVSPSVSSRFAGVVVRGRF